MTLSISCLVADDSKGLIRSITFWTTCYKVWKEILLKFTTWDRFDCFDIILNVSVHNAVSESTVWKYAGSLWDFQWQPSLWCWLVMVNIANIVSSIIFLLCNIFFSSKYFTSFVKKKVCFFNFVKNETCRE